ncbi:MATE family efflux transporter, partial [Enterocloster lavalensis]
MEENKLAVKPLGLLMLELSIPAIIAQLVSIIYNMVDRIFIGRIENGTSAMAALSVSLPVITLITAVTRLLGIGGAPLCAIKMGQKNQKGAEEILGTSFSALIAAGVIMTAAILLFHEPLLLLFGADESTLGMAAEYITLYALGTVFVMIALGMNSYITTQGFAGIGMCTVLIGAVLNIFLDALFINVFHMGVKGAAIATVIGQGVSAVWALQF